MSVGALNRHVPLSQPALSQHLARLRCEGLVETRRSGVTILYRIASPAVGEIITTLRRCFCPVPDQGHTIMTTATVTGAQLRHWHQAGEAFIIDVREPAEFAGGHIPGAINLPLARIAEADLGLAAGRKLVLVCASGRRSGMACATLARAFVNG